MLGTPVEAGGGIGMEKIKNPEDEDFSKWGGCDIPARRKADYMAGADTQ